MRYLYTGDLSDLSGGTCEARCRGLVELGKDVITLSFIPFFKTGVLKGEAIQHRLVFGPGIWKYNRRLLAMVREHRPRVVWIDKGQFITRKTLRAIKRETGAWLVCFNTDDLGYKGNGWRLHLPGIPEYDTYVTTNRFNILELAARGARGVILARLGYDRDLFRPLPVTEEDARRLGASVGFIGHWEPATEALILRLVQLGLPLRVRGHGWHKMKHKRDLRHIVENKYVRVEEYVKAISSTKVNLGINSTQSRNLSSGRSFEIPAAGGFLLAQRTVEHHAFYEEGKEAEFFDSAEELAKKARYYLDHEAERQRIAEAGRRRCITSRYSWQELMAELVQTVEQRAAPVWVSQ